MKLQDYIGLAVFDGFGLWWALFPRSVLKFYAWFHSGRVKLPTPKRIRLLGLFCIALVSIVSFLQIRGSTSSWPEAECSVVGSHIRRTEIRLAYNTPVPWYEGDYRLRYVVNGREYLTYAFSGYADKDATLVREKLDHLPVECDFTVRYNPKDPSEAVAQAKHVQRLR